MVTGPSSCLGERREGKDDGVVIFCQPMMNLVLGNEAFAGVVTAGG